MPPVVHSRSQPAQRRSDHARSAARRREIQGLDTLGMHPNESAPERSSSLQSVRERYTLSPGHLPNVYDGTLRRGAARTHLLETVHPATGRWEVAPVRPESVELSVALQTPLVLPPMLSPTAASLEAPSWKSCGCTRLHFLPHDFVEPVRHGGSRDAEV